MNGEAEPGRQQKRRRERVNQVKDSKERICEKNIFKVQTMCRMKFVIVVWL